MLFYFNFSCYDIFSFHILFLRSADFYRISSFPYRFFLLKKFKSKMKWTKTGDVGKVNTIFCCSSKVKVFFFLLKSYCFTASLECVICTFRFYVSEIWSKYVSKNVLHIVSVWWEHFIFSERVKFFSDRCKNRGITIEYSMD